MNFSASQWLAAFVLDALIKFVFFAVVSAFVSFGMIAWWSWSIPALNLSLFHFLCLFLGSSLVASFEIVKINLRPATKFWLVLLFANALFGAAVNTFRALQFVPPRSVLELSPQTIRLVVMNLISILLIYACTWILRIRRSCDSPTTTG